MPNLITTTDQPLYFGTTQNGVIVIAGLVDANGGAVATTLPIFSATDENTFLGLVAGSGGNYNPLPAVGEWVEAGAIFSYLDGLIICRQSHALTAFPPEDTPALFIVYRDTQIGALEWVAWEQVEVGTHRLYLTVEYTCLQAHVTQPEWTPPAVPNLWALVTPPLSEWVPGTYALDDLVAHIGRTWKSLMNGNTWEPGVTGTWRDQTIPPLWVAPAGSVGLWQVGDQVEYNGHLWQNTSPNNAFAPGVFGWTDLGIYP